MSVPLFEVESAGGGLNVSDALNAHITALDDSGGLDSAGQLVAEVLRMLASRLDQMSRDPHVKAYAISQISAQLLTWWDKLPPLAEGVEDGLDLAKVLSTLPAAS